MQITVGGGAAVDDRCHDLAMRDGERAGGRQMIHVVAAWFLVIGVLVGMFDVVTDLFLKDVDTGAYDRSAARPSALFAALWVAFMWRLAHRGLFCGDRGVRIRTELRTVTYPWAEIATAEARGDDLWLILAGGREVQTPVRRAEQGARRRGGIPLSPGDFNVMLNQLAVRSGGRR